jgi:hypothetical protein
MTDDIVTIDAGTLEFSDADLTASGLLIPFGVPARSNLGTFTFSSGDVLVPEDLTGMSLNIEHKREDVVGGFTRVWEQPDTGVFAAFKYANTPAGRQAYADGKSGKRKNLSAEVAKVRIRGGKALPGAVLFAGAQVEKPAFEGATLLAAVDTGNGSELVDKDAVDTNPAHISLEALALPEDITVSTPEGEQATYTPDATPAEANPEGGSTVTASAVLETPVVAGAVVPTTLLASAPTVTGVPTSAEDLDLGTVFAAIANIKNGMGSTDDAETLLAALTDIKYDASGGLTTAGSGILQPAWVGKLWQGRRYQRKYIDLCTHLYGGLQLGGRSGYTMTAGSELVQEWAGNKTDVPSGGATTAKKSSSLKKYGWAADIAREWFDLEGGADLIESLLKLVVDSYARVTDQRALTDIFTAASKTTTALDRLVAPDTFPSVDGHDYETAIGMLIQAIEGINDADDEPSFAIVNPVAWKQLIYTPKDLLPEYVSISVKAGTGEGSADKVLVKKAPQSFFAGTVTTAPQVMAGAKGAIEFRELGETPISISALDIAKGGVDEARIGYLETFVVRPESLVLIGTKP